MKKILLSALALVSLLFASCQMQEPESGKLTGEVEFSITAGIPTAITTYADPAATAFSHQGGARNLKPEEYTLRYILQVFDKEGKVAYEEVKNPDKGTFGGVTFKARLLAKKYDFVFWADFVKKDGTEFYNVGNSTDGFNLKNITYKKEGITISDLASDAADAYTKVMEVDLTQSSQTLSEPVKLQRPFGKIRLLATDALGEYNKQEERPGEVTVDFKDAVIPSVFNALAQKVKDEATMNAGKLTFTAVCEDASVNTTLYENSYLLGYSYIFASGEIPSYSMDVEVKGDQEGSGVIGTRSLSSIPVQANKLTTVIGNFYTNEGSIDVIVEDKFGNEDVKELEDLIFPEEGKVLVTKENGIESTFNTIGEALSNIGSDYAVITLAASDYNETVVIPENANIRIVGQEGTTVNAITAEKGTAVFENIKFDGNQTYNENATVYALGASNLTLLNCVIEPQNSETRAIASIPGFAGTFKLEGCTINSSKGTYFYLNAASESGKIILKNNTFTGKGGSIEIMNAKGDTKKYPVVDGNNFGLLNPSFTYWSDPVITEQSQLDPDTKQYVSEFLSNNTVPAGVKVAPFGGSSFLITSLPLNITNQTTGKKYETIREAVIYAEDGHTIAIEEGNYDLGAPAQVDNAGSNDYYLRVDKSLSFVGNGEVTITTSHEAESNIGGTGSLQNLITVDAANVSFKNITFKANYNGYYSGPNKIIEVRNTGFSISDCKFIPNENAPEDCGSAVYFSQNADNGVVKNCEINYATVSFDGLMEGNFTVKGNTFVEGNDNVAFTTPNWTQKDMAKSELYVIVEGNTFEGFEEYGEGVNPAIKVSYGILDLKDNQFPTGGIYWKAMPGSGIEGFITNFGSVFVDYNSPVSQTWTNDPDFLNAPDYDQPKSFAISNDIIELETTDKETSAEKMVGHGATVPGMSIANKWEVVSKLTITDDVNQEQSKCIFIAVEEEDDGGVVEYAGIQFVRNETGDGEWQYWIPGEDWRPFENVNNIEPREYEVKITFNGGVITYTIDGAYNVTNIQLNTSSTTRIGVIYLISKVCENSYKTTWSYPIVNF